MPALAAGPVLALGLALSSAAATGCGGDDDFDAPTCADGEVRLEGTIDGGSESAAQSGFTSYIFVNALGDQLGTLTVNFGGEEMLYLEWPDLIANGDSGDARGSVAFAGLDYGSCDDDGFPGTIRLDQDGDGGAFRLTALHPAGDCAAAAVDGELTGCFRTSPR